MADIAMLAKMKPAFITQQLTLILCMKHLGGFNPQEQLILTSNNKLYRVVRK